MKRSRLLAVLLLTVLGSTAVTAQTLDSIFTLIKNNNLTVKKHSAQCMATTAEAKTTLAFENPEVEYGHLWGSPEGIGQRNDISISQSLDLATLFGTRRREARSREQLAYIIYEQELNTLLLAAEELVIDIVYANKIVNLLDERLATTREIAQASEKMLKQGEINVLDASETRLALFTAETKREKAVAERDALNERLRAMGADVLYSSTEYPVEYLRGDCSREVSAQEAAVAEQALATTKAEGLPDVTVGYMAELTHDEKYRGVTVGVSIPLWGNRRNVARAKAEQMLAQVTVSESEHNLAKQQAELHRKVESQRAIVTRMQTGMAQLDTSNLLLKALKAGEISPIEFIANRQRLYDLQDEMLAAEHELQLTMAQEAFVTKRQ